MDDRYREVRFDKYCETCKYKETKDTDEPCDGCLENTVNLYSEKPVNYAEKTAK